MSSKLHITITKLKRVSIALASVLSALILAILPINFTASALDDATYNGNVVNLPFSSPQSFGNCPAVVMYNEMRGRYEYFVFSVDSDTLTKDNVRIFIRFSPPPSDYSKSNYFGGFQVNMQLTTPETSGSSNYNEYHTAKISLYWFSWYPGNTSYNYQRINSWSIGGSSGQGASYNPSLADGTYYSFSSVFLYNSISTDSSFKTSHPNFVYVFQGSDGQGVMINQLNSLIGYNQQVVFYLDEILNKLDNGSDYVPEETTSNADMSNYEDAEGALMDNNIENLNNLDMPDLGSFNSGSQNNAFKFISSNIEFFSGMNGQGSVAKIATVLFVILGLGLTSFIIGLSNRRKGG